MARPSRPLLDGDRIRTAALALIDRDGLTGFSMRRLAAELGVQAASLYGHVSTKDDLLNDLADQIMANVDVSGFRDGDWRNGLRVWARSYRAALAAHPNLVPFLAYGPGRRPQALRSADSVHGGLIRAGWPPRYATMIGASTKFLVVGAATTSFAAGFADDATLYDTDQYPHLGQAHLLPRRADTIDQDSFELALTALLDGLTTLRARVLGPSAS